MKVQNYLGQLDKNREKMSYSAYDKITLYNNLANFFTFCEPYINFFKDIF
jgi:phospholipase C